MLRRSGVKRGGTGLSINSKKKNSGSHNSGGVKISITDEQQNRGIRGARYLFGGGLVGAGHKK